MTFRGSVVHRREGERPAVLPASHTMSRVTACHSHAQNTPALPAAVGAATLPSPGGLVTYNQGSSHLPPGPPHTNTRTFIFTHPQMHEHACSHIHTQTHPRAHPRVHTGCSVSGLWETRLSASAASGPAGAQRTGWGGPGHPRSAPRRAAQEGGLHMTRLASAQMAKVPVPIGVRGAVPWGRACPRSISQGQRPPSQTLWPSPPESPVRAVLARLIL